MAITPVAIVAVMMVAIQAADAANHFLKNPPGNSPEDFPLFIAKCVNRLEL